MMIPNLSRAYQQRLRVAIEYGGGEGEHQHAIAMVSTAKHKSGHLPLEEYWYCGDHDLLLWMSSFAATRGILLELQI